MPTRVPRVALVVLLVLAGGSWFRDARAAPTGTPAVGELGQVAQREVRHQHRCRGIDRRAVQGEEPRYTRKKLAEFRNHKRVCHGIWLPNPRRYLVPQGLAISGRTAWISGFRYRQGYGERPCQLVRVDIVTGRRLAFHSAIYGQVGDRPRTYCRHGGGIIQRGRWLWLVEKNKLWLVDSTQRSTVLRATRVWRLAAPVRGSSIVARGDRVGMVPFETRGVARIHWFSFKRLLKPGVLDLAVRHDGRRQLGPIVSTRIPRLVQGATLDAAGRLYLSRSNLSCGELVTPYGRRVAFIPGAEGLQFASHGRRLWAVSESGAWPYAVSRKPFTPAVASFEWPHLFRGKVAGCRFPAY
ncbi:MAG: hypothetical protein ABWX73_08630 [Marmoricola sp.]